MSMSRMAPFELTCEIFDVSSEKLCYNACFYEVHRRKNRIKMVVPEVVETRDTIKFCVKLGYKPTEIFGLLQRGGGCLKNEKSTLFKWRTRSKQGQRAFKMALGVDAGR